MKKEDVVKGMEIDVCFRAKIYTFTDKGIYAKRIDMPSNDLYDNFIPFALCTPVLPNFEPGDVVEWEYNGLICQATVIQFVFDKILDESVLDCKDAYGRNVNPNLTKCRIVRKAEK
jgi:hypothetical protein